MFPIESCKSADKSQLKLYFVRLRWISFVVIVLLCKKMQLISKYFAIIFSIQISLGISPEKLKHS